MTAVLTDIYRSLRTVGLTRGQVAAILPEWWAPEMAQTQSGLRETALLLGRRLCLDAAALLEGRVEHARDLSAPLYKHTIRVTEQQLRPATLIASSLAKAVVGAMPARAVELPASAQSIREQILGEELRVDFDSILNFCWTAGVPVIPLPNLPNGVRKMDAAAIKVGDRPVILIALRNNSKAWLSFLLAHELGHLSLGHVPTNSALIEGSLNDSTDFEVGSGTDRQEVEANEFANNLLSGGRSQAVVDSWSNDLPPVTIATSALSASQNLRTAPGHLVLRYAFRTRRWPDARSALNFLSDDMDAQAGLIERLRAEIDTRRIGDDLSDYVLQVTGVARRG